MPKSEITGPEQTDRSIVDKLWSKRAEVLWGLGAVVLLLTFVNPVVLIGLALLIATIAAAWAGFYELLDRAKKDDARRAVASVNPAPTGRREPEKTATHTPWHGRNAAA